MPAIDKFHPKQAFVVSIKLRSDKGIMNRIPLYDLGEVAEPTQKYRVAEVPASRDVVFTRDVWVLVDGGYRLVVSGAEFLMEVLRRSRDSYGFVDTKTFPADEGVAILTAELFDGMAVWISHSA